MYWWQRVMRDLRDARDFRLEKRVAEGAQFDWFGHFKAARTLVWQLAGRGGGDVILDTARLKIFVDRSVAAVREIAVEMDLDAEIERGTAENIRQFLIAKSEPVASREESASRLLSIIGAVLRISSVSARQAAYFEILRALMEADDAEVVAQQAKAPRNGSERGAVAVVDGVFKRHRRRRKETEAATASEGPSSLIASPPGR